MCCCCEDCGIVEGFVDIVEVCGIVDLVGVGGYEYYFYVVVMCDLFGDFGVGWFVVQIDVDKGEVVFGCCGQCVFMIGCDCFYVVFVVYQDVFQVQCYEDFVFDNEGGFGYW